MAIDKLNEFDWSRIKEAMNNETNRLKRAVNSNAEGPVRDAWSKILKEHEETIRKIL